ncbi:MAG: ABC transporter substrate-binding protein [Hungatella sp.]|jgi:NitT/TauT family transport system substrate-binding protein|nr:ABC transporter substrate-binding protein [Hungatella sp.]
MKKALSMIMACAMAAALLTGCSASTPKTQETTEAVTTADTTTAETAAETTQVKEKEPETTVKESEAQTSQEEAGEKVTLRVGSMKGPTTMGLVSLMDKSSKEEAEGSYEFTMVTAADELVGQIVSGNLDIALVPANMASILYKKTNKGIAVINVNTLGVLYVVTADESVETIADLKGKTVYMTGKGTTPDYVFQYLLTANGLNKEDVTVEYKSEATEVAAVLKEQEGAIGLLPQPFVTVALAQNESLHMAMDLNEEWEKVQGEDGSRLVTGVTVCRKELLDNTDTRKAVELFMDEHYDSASFANLNVKETAELVASAGIIEKAPVAEKAIPYCSIVCLNGAYMKEILPGYLEVLYQQEPSSVGGELPDDGFYYLP